MRFIPSLESIAKWSVYLLLGLVPFFFLPLEWTTVEQAKMLLLTLLAPLAAFAWIAASFKRESLQLPSSFLLFAVTLLPLSYFISAAAAGFRWESFVGSGTELDTVIAAFLLFVLFLVSIHILSASEMRIHRGIRVLAIGSAVLLLIQIGRLAFPQFTLGGAFASSGTVFGSWHDLCIFLGAIIYLSLAVLDTPIAPGRWRFFFIPLAVVSVAMLIIVNFRDVWIGLGALALFHVLYLWWRQPESVYGAGKQVLWWLGFTALSFILFWGGTFLHDKLPENIRVVQFEVRPSWSGTYLVGQGALSDSGIFFGSGPNTFPREWRMYKPPEVNATQFWNVDFYKGIGSIPTSFVTLGLLGLLAWGAIMLALLATAGRTLFLRMSGSRDPFVFGIVAGTVLYLTAFHILYIPGPALSILTFVFFGALVALEVVSGARRTWSLSLSGTTTAGRIGGVVVGICSIILLVAGIQSVRALSSDALVNRAIVVVAKSNDTAGASRSIARALSILPNNDRAHRAGVELGMLELAALMQKGSESEGEQLRATLNETIQHGLAAVSIEDRNYQNWLTLARLYGELAGVGVEGAEQNARDAYAKVLEKNPTSPLPLVGIAQLDMAKGSVAEARVQLEKALAMKGDLAIAHYLLSQLEANAGNLPKAVDHALAAAQVANQDPAVWYSLGAILYAMKDYENASQALLRAVGLRNNYADALYLLGLCFEQLKNVDGALVAIKAVLALNPDNAMLKEKLAHLEALKRQ